MTRTVPLVIAAALLFSCAAERKQLPTELDPSNPDAPEAAPFALSADQGASNRGDRQHVPGAHSHAGGTVTPPANDQRTGEVTPPGKNQQTGDLTPPTTGPDDHAANPSATVYSCPMHPEVQSDKPGRCPKCGMPLQKRGAQ